MAVAAVFKGNQFYELPRAAASRVALDAAVDDVVLVRDLDGDKSIGMSLVNVTTGAATRIRTFNDPNLQSAFADSSERFHVWEESADPDSDFSDWTLRAYDRTTKSVFVVAQHEKGANGKPLPGLPVIPRLAGNRVLFSAVTARDGMPHLDSFEVDLTTRRKRTLARDAADPVQVGTTTVVRTKTTSDSLTVNITALPADGPPRKLTTGNFSGMTACNGRVLLTDISKGDVHLHDLTTGERLLTIPATDRFPSFPTCTGNWFGWSQSDSSYALNATTRQLVRLGSRENANSVKAAAGTLIWAETSDDDRPRYRGVRLR